MLFIGPLNAIFFSKKLKPATFASNSWLYFKLCPSTLWPISNFCLEALPVFLIEFFCLPGAFSFSFDTGSSVELFNRFDVVFDWSLHSLSFSAFLFAILQKEFARLPVRRLGRLGFMLGSLTNSCVIKKSDVRSNGSDISGHSPNSLHHRFH
jgi:hypothetical protein